MTTRDWTGVTQKGAGGQVLHRLRTLYERERLLFAVGLTGIVIGIACLWAVQLRGRYVPPEGDLTKPAAFDIAVGLYVLTLALYAPFARFTHKGHRRWVTVTAAFALYGYATETVQHVRGIDPRFSAVAPPAERLLGLVFFLTALALIPLFAVLVAKIRRGRARELLPLSVAYAAVSVAIGFGSGIWMSAQSGSRVGDADILPLHAIGFHGLQAVPLVALLLVWAGRTDAPAKRIVHAAGAAWLIACAGVLLQTLARRRVDELSPAIALAGAGLVVWAFSALRAVLVWRASGWRVPPLPELAMEPASGSAPARAPAG